MKNKKKGGDISSTGAFFDDGSFPFGGSQLLRVVLVVMDDLNAIQLARRAAQFRYETLVDGVQVALEQGVVASGIRHSVLMLASKLSVMAITFAHEDVDLARFQYPIEAGQLAEVDFQRMRTAFLTFLRTAGTVTRAGFTTTLDALLAGRVLAK